MTISGKDVQKLRAETSVGIMDCKKALTDANGDFEKAKEILKKKGAMKALKKSERVANQGIITSYIHANGKIGVLLELSCETDFAAKNPLFSELGHNVAMQIASMNPKNEAELLKQDFIKEPDKNIKELLDENIAKIGENIKIKRYTRYLLGE
jgi:elongation factor Ts